MSNQLKSASQIIIFTRYPQAGCVKTRLIPKLGEKGAAQLHQELVEHILKKISPIATCKTQLSVYYTGGSQKQMSQWLGESISLTEQRGSNLGYRMMNAFREAKKHNFQRTILIGSDCPAIDTSLIDYAFKKLINHDLVLGPTFDGGYYLIGLAGNVPDKKVKSLFSGISWGTESVYTQTVKKANSANISLHTLQKYYDIDRPQDLEHFNNYSNSQ